MDNPAVIGELIPHVTERLSGGGVVRRPVGDPVRGYYPAVIDMETWTRARAIVGGRGTTCTSGRGRHAGQPVRHLLAGVATCPVCEGTMTRVSKGPGGGRAYLVCAKAKRGAGCVYRTVPVEIVEKAVLGGRVGLLSEAPSSTDAEAALRDELAGLELDIEGVVDEREELGRARRQSRRPRLLVERQREANLYAEQQRLEDRRKAVQEALAGSGSRLVSARINRLWDLLDATTERDEGEGRTTANLAVREAFLSVVVDHVREELVFHWRHGGESVLRYGNPFVDGT